MTDYRPPTDGSQAPDGPATPAGPSHPLAPPTPIPPPSAWVPPTVAPPPPSAMPAPSGSPYATEPTGAGHPAPSPYVPQRAWRSSTDVLAWVTVGLLLAQVALYAYVMRLDEEIMSALEQRDVQGAIAISDSAPPLPGISSLLYVITAVCFLIWLHRVWTSDRSDPSGYSRSSGLAIGGWFIPLAAWVMGPLTLRDLWTGTRQARPGAAPQPRKMPGLVVCYAIAWAVGSLLTLSSRGLIQQANTATTREAAINGLQQALQAEQSAVLVSAVAATLLLVVIVKIVGFTKR